MFSKFFILMKVREFHPRYNRWWLVLWGLRDEFHDNSNTFHTSAVEKFYISSNLHAREFEEMPLSYITWTINFYWIRLKLFRKRRFTFFLSAAPTSIVKVLLKEVFWSQLARAADEKFEPSNSFHLLSSTWRFRQKVSALNLELFCRLLRKTLFLTVKLARLLNESFHSIDGDYVIFRSRENLRKFACKVWHL